MKLVCPACGATASAESWLNDAVCREAVVTIAHLPQPLSQVLFGYFSLFRPGKRALSWKKALRLAKEINTLTTPGHVQVQGKVARPCPPTIWAQAMEQMQERRNSLSLPMPNHNYLRQVAWELADRADCERESTGHQHEAHGRASSHRGVDPLEKVKREWDQKNKGKIPVELPDFVIKGMEDATNKSGIRKN